MTAAKRMPLCGNCDDGWIIDADTLLPTRRCPCRRTPQQVKRDTLAAVRHTHESAFDHAVKLITEHARHNRELSANSLRDLFDLADIPQPVRGAAFAKAARDGIITELDRLPSTQQSTHGHRIGQYVSRVYRRAS